MKGVKLSITIMKKQADILRISFYNLVHLFTEATDKALLLDPCTGKGSVWVFNLENGLQARLWNCYFTEPTEVYNRTEENAEEPYFILAHFLDTKGVTLKAEGYNENASCDCFFLSTGSDHTLVIESLSTIHCLSISFSKSWLCRMLESNQALKELKEKLCATDHLSFISTMTQPERTLVQELATIGWHQQFGSFYMKSGVLKLASNFLHSLKLQDTLLADKLPSNDFLSEVEQYLTENIKDPFPDLKALAGRFSISESTLTRQFKKRYGITMSAYFNSRKMAYARQLMQEKGISLKEAACTVGYQSIYNFSSMFRRYYGAIRLKESKGRRKSNGTTPLNALEDYTPQES